MPAESDVLPDEPVTEPQPTTEPTTEPVENTEIPPSTTPEPAAGLEDPDEPPPREPVGGPPPESQIFNTGSISPAIPPRPAHWEELRKFKLPQPPVIPTADKVFSGILQL